MRQLIILLLVLLCVAGQSRGFDAVKPGQLIVAEDRSFLTGPISDIVVIEPSTGFSKPIAYPRLLAVDLKFLRTNLLLFTTGAFGLSGGSILYIDFASGTSNAFSPSLPDSSPLAIDKAGNIYVWDPLIISPLENIRIPVISKMDPVTKVRWELATDGFLSDPTAMTIDENGKVLVAVPGAVSRIVRIDPIFGDQTSVSSNGLIHSPSALVIDTNGTILVGDFETGLFSVDPSTGQQTMISTGSVHGVTVGLKHEIFVTAKNPTDDASGVWRVNRQTGARTRVASLPGIAGSIAVVPFLDSDGDGIVDETDAFPNTPLGAVVDATGASLNQLVPCDLAWKNHSAYVRAFNKQLKAFFKAKLINRTERTQLQKAAAKSTCGRPIR